MKGIVKYDESTICLSRQQVAILKEWLKIRGCGSLKEDFYTRFIPENDGFGAVTWLKKENLERQFQWLEIVFLN